MNDLVKKGNINYEVRYDWGEVSGFCAIAVLYDFDFWCENKEVKDDYENYHDEHYYDGAHSSVREFIKHVLTEGSSKLLLADTVSGRITEFFFGEFKNGSVITADDGRKFRIRKTRPYLNRNSGNMVHELWFEQIAKRKKR